jgi:hypothetical protein
VNQVFNSFDELAHAKSFPNVFIFSGPLAFRNVTDFDQSGKWYRKQEATGIGPWANATGSLGRRFF